MLKWNSHPKNNDVTAAGSWVVSCSLFPWFCLSFCCSNHLDINLEPLLFVDGGLVISQHIFHVKGFEVWKSSNWNNHFYRGGFGYQERPIKDAWRFQVFTASTSHFCESHQPILWPCQLNRIFSVNSLYKLLFPEAKTQNHWGFFRNQKGQNPPTQIPSPKFKNPSARFQNPPEISQCATSWQPAASWTCSCAKIRQQKERETKHLRKSAQTNFSRIQYGAPFCLSDSWNQHVAQMFLNVLINLKESW